MAQHPGHRTDQGAGRRRDGGQQGGRRQQHRRRCRGARHARWLHHHVWHVDWPSTENLCKDKYDARTSFEPVGLRSVSLPNILVVRSGLGVADVQELIAKEKAKPGTLNYASSGNGASSHLAGVLFNEMTGTPAPTCAQGHGAQRSAGQVDMTFTDILTAMPYIKTDKVKALGVATAKRSSAMPDIPTIAEQGVKGYDVDVFLAWWPRARQRPPYQGLEPGVLRRARLRQGQAEPSSGLEGSSNRHPLYWQSSSVRGGQMGQGGQQAGVQLD